MKFKKIITVSGRISSGKSYAANLINQHYGFPIASFGGYLKYYCEINNLPTDRKTLQDIGRDFMKENSEAFLSVVLAHFSGDSDIVILEGIRHKTILEDVRKLTQEIFTIFVDTDVQIRYERYCKRNKDADIDKSYEAFIIADNHPVELEINDLKSICNLVVDGNENYEEILFQSVDIFS